MKKVFVFVLLALSLGVIIVSCKQSDPITTEIMIGKWIIKDKVGGFTTDCEKNEYILFNADSTLYRHQCGADITGTWYTQDGKLILNITLDSTTVNSPYSCDLISNTEIKIVSKKYSVLWAKYTKE